MKELLNNTEKKLLLNLARKSIETKLDGTTIPELNFNSFSKIITEKTGCFVTLHKNGELRGCIGYILGIKPLYQAIIDNARNAAFSDPRFPMVRKEEMDFIQIEITILSQPRELKYSDKDDLLDKIVPFEDGLIINKSYHQATFLPQVWEQLPKKEDFLTHLCYKAGLPPNEWEKGTLVISVYRAYYFNESDLNEEKNP